MIDYKKDAIHVAIATVKAGEDLSPGDWVGFQDQEGVAFKDAHWLGIVNPFSNGPVKKGQDFQLYLKPNSVTSLTHQWEHPLFNRDPDRIAIAENWLKFVCNYNEYWGEQEEEYDNYSRIVRDFKAGDLGFWASGDDFSEKYNSNKDGFRKKFWDNLEVVTGVMATKEQREQEYFSCSC